MRLLPPPCCFLQNGEWKCRASLDAGGATCARRAGASFAGLTGASEEETTPASTTVMVLLLRVYPQCRHGFVAFRPRGSHLMATRIHDAWPHPRFGGNTGF